MGGQVRIQIYTMQSVAEAEAVAAIGVDHVGVTPADLGLPGEIGLGLARDICRALDGLATSVALSVESDLDAIVTMASAVRPDVLHLCGPPGAIPPDGVVELRRMLPSVSVMQAVAVSGPDAIDAALSYAPFVDFLILDSVAPDIPGIGAAGVVHDWRVSAAIVDAVDVPVFLAGGLSSENVAGAIAAVQPWGVDSLTHTNTVTNGGFRKDLGRIEAFVAAVREGRRP